MTNPFLYLQRNADTSPNGVFLQSATATVTNAEAVVQAKKIAFELRRLGVKAGQVVALDLPDQLSILFTEAVYHEGAISTVLPSGYVAGAVPVEWVFTNRTAWSYGSATVVAVDARFLQQIDENPYGISPSNEPIDTLRIVFSSGTTGTPKAIALKRDMERVMDAVLTSWFEGGPTLNMMDTGTAAGIGELYLCVKAAQPYLSVGGTPAAGIITVIDRSGAKKLRGSPAQIAAVVDELERQQRTLPAITSITFAGTVMAPGLADRVQRAFEGCTILSSYGSTEAGAAAMRVYSSDDPYDAGRILPGSVIEIVDADDHPLPVGETGRIRHRAPAMATEYLGNPEATSRAFIDGWFYPGDLGFIRPDGGLSLAGRESELLNAGGVKIDPNRLDQFALQNAGVLDACSFDYTSSSGLSAVGLVLVTEDDIDIHSLVAELKSEFGAASPTLVARVESIQRTATGKPMRRALSEKYSER